MGQGPFLDQVLLTYREYDMAHELTEGELSDVNAWLLEQLDTSA
ncbi:hypothetical protein ACFFLM_05520 [Deinococcus oregonensis]|uniref:Uncharacterized protein n=1 Tax=Deinococcus oregonensis TaxID=1805970 RepID=A0ABV6AYZ7_9DEIO